jgi:predicted nucleic acid-binding protein
MKHGFIETNWVVDVAAPRHHQRPIARALLEQCIGGELALHVPAICFVEARAVIRKRFQPRNEADAIRNFLGWSRENDQVADGDAEATLRVLDRFESTARRELQGLDATLNALRRTANLDVFALNDRMLQLSVELSFVASRIFRPGNSGGSLGRVDELREDPTARFMFCEKDGHLQPWDKAGNTKQPLASIYDERRVWVYGDFDMSGGRPPDGWPDAVDA